MEGADGRVLDDRYRLDRWVASGGFGEVWQATDLVLGRPVAVKVLRPDRAANPQVMARFRVEARRASSVTHQNVARIFDYNDEAAGQPPFLVMEFVEGQSLADLLADGPLAVPTTLAIVAEVAAGIDAAHQAGLFHLDVKPANVLLSADGAVKVTDFGIGTASTEHASEGIGCLTPAYLAPECVIGERGTPTADLYSLGVLAHECLSGKPPFTGTPLQVAVAHQVSDPPPLPAAIPAAVAALIMELTDKDPEGRPGSAAEVAKRASALRKHFAPHTPVGHSVAPAAARLPQARALARRPWRVRFLIVPVAAVAVAVSALLLAGRAGEGNLPARNAIPAGRATVRVDGAAFKNLPVSVADWRLRRMGFLVRIRWRRSAGVPAGLVIAVRPTGQLPLGSLVTVLGSGPPEGSGRITLGRPARNRHRKGKHGPHHGPTGKPSHSPKASSSASPHPTPTASPSPTGTPSPTPSQSPTSSPMPSGSPSSDTAGQIVKPSPYAGG